VIKLAEHYGDLAPENFVNAVSSTEGRPDFDSTANNNEETQEAESLQVSDLMDKKG